ncbi:DAK2 domain-containing protein [Spongiactinospora sp. TRM90649]|uniref:DAK2 domain-containing protein n=1 Tax=Spongiactinospora sp. TRM90649 TaxID=3031114 RepID=UPI0023F83262|nr:DAK2 domain-containing protein [Spongiactinospora sp. TRM90649]MDF5753327.1 DAK2 domain-containing protein [Spongiactinospora sp. TRM90649]
MLKVLDPPAVRRWVRLSADALGRARSEIDSLNVFPVPDGDTGTNLHLTMLSAAEAVEVLPGDASAESVWAALSRGALVGARGNSGVIVSQALRGLAEILRAAEGDGADLRRALARAAELARDAVAHPVEGTVLTVLAAAASPGGGGNLAEVARSVAERAASAVRRTPDQLGVLARNGVVDAGGAGLAVILDSLAAVVTDVYTERVDIPRRSLPAVPAEDAEGRGYEVMYLLDVDPADHAAVPALKDRLDALGDSLVIVGGEGLWNVHVHVDDAGAAIEAGMAAGRPYRIKVTWLGADGGPQRHAREGTAGRGVVAVAAGDGLAALFEQAGAVVVRREPGGGVSLPALREAIARAGSEVVVLPNDVAVREVASAAAVEARERGVTVGVLPTKASVQGLAALAVHDPLRRFDDDVVAMADAAGHTRHGHVWVADREAVTSAGVCRPGDVLGVVDGDVAVIGTALAPTAVEVTRRMLSSGSELVTLVAGEDGAPLVTAVRDHLGEIRPDVEVVVIEGGQGGYPLLVGVE